MNPTSHIGVCVCTYKRPELLKRLLDGLRNQETGGLFTYSIVVADNESFMAAPTLTYTATAGKKGQAR